MVKMETCWNCNKEKKEFCRKHEVKKNTAICERVQVNDFNGAKRLLE